MKVRKIESSKYNKYLFLKNSLKNDNIEQIIENKYIKYLSLIKKEKKQNDKS